MTKDVLQRAKELDKRASETDTDIGKSIEALIKAGKQTKSSIRWLRIIAAIQSALVLTIAYLGFYTVRNNLSIEQNRNTLVAVCRSDNEERAQHKTLWNYILSIPPDEPITPERQQRIDAFKVQLDKTFAEKDCNKIVETI